MCNGDDRKMVRENCAYLLAWCKAEVNPVICHFFDSVQKRDIGG